MVAIKNKIITSYYKIQVEGIENENNRGNEIGQGKTLTNVV